MVKSEANIILENIEKLQFKYLKKNHEERKYSYVFEKMHPVIRNISEKKFLIGIILILWKPHSKKSIHG